MKSLNNNKHTTAGPLVSNYIIITSGKHVAPVLVYHHNLVPQNAIAYAALKVWIPKTKLFTFSQNRFMVRFGRPKTCTLRGDWTAPTELHLNAFLHISDVMQKHFQTHNFQNWRIDLNKNKLKLWRANMTIWQQSFDTTEWLSLTVLRVRGELAGGH